MRIDLNIPAGQRQNEFLDYLNAGLRKRLSRYCASAESICGDVYVVNIEGLFSAKAGNLELKWQVAKQTNGTLLWISVISADPQVNEVTWRTEVDEFIHSVNAAVHAERRNKYFFMALLNYFGPRLDGEYWLQDFRFAPAVIQDKYPKVWFGEQIVSICQDVDAIDDLRASEIFWERARRHAAHLSLLLDFGLSFMDNRWRWITPIVDGKHAQESEKMLLGYRHPNAIYSEMPAKGAVDSLGEFKGKFVRDYFTVGEPLSLPPETNIIFESFQKAQPQILDAFDRCARLYQVALVCGRIFPSVEFAYRVAAINSLMRSDRKSKHMVEFMKKQLNAKDADERLLKYLWGTVRSNHFHAGDFPMGEFDAPNYSDPILNIENAFADSQNLSARRLTRKVIVNWIQRNLCKSSDAAS